MRETSEKHFEEISNKIDGAEDRKNLIQVRHARPSWARDFREKMLPDSSQKSKRLEEVRDPVLKHNHVNSRYTVVKNSEYYFPEYNFSNLASVFEVDSIVHKAFERQEILCTKEGWDFVSSNEKSLSYIKERMEEIRKRTGVSFSEVLQTLVSDLIRFNNSFLAVTRDQKKGEAKLGPISGYFPIPIETVMIRFDEKGNPVGIKQVFDHSTKEVVFNKDSYIHFYIGYKGGKSVSLPSLIPVLDDLIALRRYEENMLIMMHQFAYPVYLYKVGTENAPCQIYPDGTTELDVAANNVANTPTDGFLFVPERHEMDVLGAKNQALDAIPGLEYLKKRVLSGANVSALDLGEGDSANRSTSDNLSQMIVDRGKFIHRQVERMVLEMILIPLLEESTFGSDVLKEENVVKLQFREIDLLSQIKKQNHFAQLFSQHAITMEELRLGLGMDKMTDELFERTYFKLIEEPKLLLAAKSSAFGAEASALARHPSSSIEEGDLKGEQEQEEKKAKEEAEAKKIALKQAEEKSRGQKAGAGQQTPSNQHGKKEGPDPRKSSLDLGSFLDSVVSEAQESFLSKNWNEIKKNASKKKTIKEVNFIIGLSLNSMKNYFKNEIDSEILKSFRMNGGDLRVPYLTNSLKTQVDFYLDELFAKLTSDINKKISRDKREVLEVLETFNWRINLIDSTEKRRANLYGRIRSLLSNGAKEVQVKKVKEDKIIKKLSSLCSFSECPPISHPNSEEEIELVAT